MEVLFIALLFIFFILVAGLGIQNTFKILPVVFIFALLIYFVGWVVIKFALPILIFLIIYGLFSNKNKGKNSSYSKTYGTRVDEDDFFNSYKKTGNSTHGTYGTFNSREEAEEFFRTFFGGGFGQGSTNTNGNTYGGNTYGNGGYQKNNSYTYTTDKSKYYSILGINKGASQDEIKKAYHKLAKEHHPDRFVNSSESEKKYHENKMKEINDAYDNLTK